MTEYPGHGTVRIHLELDDEDQLTIHHACVTDDPKHVYEIPVRTWETWTAVRMAYAAMVDDIAYTYVFPRRDQEEEE
jgi:hypothetical protein